VGLNDYWFSSGAESIGLFGTRPFDIDIEKVHLSVGAEERTVVTHGDRGVEKLCRMIFVAFNERTGDECAVRLDRKLLRPRKHWSVERFGNFAHGCGPVEECEHFRKYH